MPAAVMAVSAGVLEVEAALVLLLGLAAAAVLRQGLACVRAGAAPPRAVAAAALGIGLLSLGARLGVAEGHVSWAPYLDQWGAEVSGVAAPLAHGTLDAGDLFAGNNEHRVFLTRSISLGVILANGCWDNRVMVLANFLLESAAVAWASLLAWSLLGWAWGSLVAAAALLPMFLVCDWEGIMWSNQTQFVAMAAGSVFALSLSRERSLSTLAGWGAVAAALVTLGSMASGFLAPACMAAIACLAAWQARSGWRSAAAFSAVCLALALVGWESRAPYPALGFLYARGAADWARSLLAYASWPLPANPAGLAFLWLPWCALLWRALARREAGLFPAFVLGLGLWVLLQACALAWARAGLSSLVSSRYVDFLGWGVVANAGALATLGAAGRRRAAAWAVAALWLAALGAAEVRLSGAVYRPYFETFRGYTLEHERRLGTFMRTGDSGLILGQEFPKIPLYNPQKIVTALEDPVLRPLLPGPLRRDYVRDKNPGEVASERDGPLSLLAVGALRSGPWFEALGAAALAAAALLARRGAGGRA